MTAWRACVLFALAALAGCATQPQTSADARVAFAGPNEQYIVVTVRNPAALLPRAGSTLRDYDAPARYGASPAARREVRALAAAHGLVEVDGWPIAALGVHCVVFKLPPGASATEALRQLQRDSRVESVQPLNTFSTLSTTSDPYRALQRNLDAMHVAQAHAWSRGENVRVAVIDTGMDTTHPDLSGKIVVQKNFVDASTTLAPERHGTAIAGVIAAIDNNREGIAGIAPAASLVGLKACWQHDDASAAVCNTFTLAKALAAAIDARSDIVNLSLGGPPDPLLERLVDHGANRGVIYVGAALPQGEVGFPCNVASVICVGSAGQWLEGPQLFAPGNEVLTLVPGGRYDFVSGSSLAAASVSASIALLRARDPDLTSQSALRLLASSVRSDGRSVADDQAPSIDVCRALSRLLRTAGCPN